eukprot:COSAG02_NODE_15578_length_1158_cov_174.685552_1_plen_152_part_00
MVLKTKNRSRRASTNQRSEVSDVQRSNVSKNNRLKFRLQLPHGRSNTRNFQVRSRVFIILVVPRYTSVHLVYNVNSRQHLLLGRRLMRGRRLRILIAGREIHKIRSTVGQPAVARARLRRWDMPSPKSRAQGMPKRRGSQVCPGTCLTHRS